MGSLHVGVDQVMMCCRFLFSDLCQWLGGCDLWLVGTGCFTVVAKQANNALISVS